MAEVYWMDGADDGLRSLFLSLCDPCFEPSGDGRRNKRVYIAARAIPAGHTKTYGEIARLIGEPNAAREVGASLGRNPFAIIVPCHRVLAANGKTGGFSAAQGVKTKLELLNIEGGGGPLFEQLG